MSGKRGGGARSELTEACNDGGCEMMVMAVLKFVEERERRWKEEEEEERFAWQLASQAITAPPLPSQASVRFGKRKRHTHTLPLTFKREGEGGRKMEEGGREPPSRLWTVRACMYNVCA